jgi:hypothetical protein
MNDPARRFSPMVQAVIEDLMPICRSLAEGRGRYAISIGGSQGKGLSDPRSDIDFRLFHERDLPWTDTRPELWAGYFQAEARWRARGVLIDGIWARKIGDIDAALNRWIEGAARPDDLVWTIWGYHLLPDIHHQAILEDPFNVIGEWKRRLSVYPPKLKKALLDKHLGSARYWRQDYHYASKVRRGDAVFLAGLTSRLVHDLIQILFALNETYYVGDGQNLQFVEKFSLKPDGFVDRVVHILYPPAGDDRYERQYDHLARLIDDVARVAEIHGSAVH